MTASFFQTADSRLQLNIEDTIPPMIHAVGELDHQNCDELGVMIRETLDNGCSTVALGLGGLDYIDSSGVRVLVKMAYDARRNGGSVRIDSISHQLHRVLETSGFKHLFDMSSDPSEIIPSSGMPEKPAAGSSLSFQVPAVISSCRDARNQVANFASSVGITPPLLDDIKLAVGEAFSNAARHGAQTEGWIFVKCRADGEYFTVVIRYPSDTFDPNSVPIPDPSNPSEGGMGIYFMNLIMDEVTYSFDGGYTILTLKKRIC